MPPSRGLIWIRIWLALSIVFVLAGIPVGQFLSRRGDASLALYWFVSLGSLAASAAVALRQSYLRGERELRRRQGLCPQCGYNLRASPQRCPECGTPVVNA